jgi:hypothetical protein
VMTKPRGRRGILLLFLSTHALEKIGSFTSEL